MKTYLSFFKLLLLTIALLSVFSCKKDNTYEGSATFRKDIESFAEFAFLKDELETQWLCYISDDFTKEYFKGEVSQQEYQKYFETLNKLASNWDRYEKAVKVMDNTGILITPTTKGILSSLYEFGSWVTGAGKRSRERIITVASNISAEERSKIYDGLKKEWKSKSSSEADFWNKLEKGDYDTQASRMFTEFQQSNEEFLFTSYEKNLTVHKIVAAEGAVGLEKGASVVVDVVGDVTGLGTGMDIANMAVMTTDLVNAKSSDEAVDIIKNMTQTGVGLYLDLGGFDGADAAKYCMDVANIVSDKIKSKSTTESNISYFNEGYIKVRDEDPSETCDIVVASRKSPSGNTPSAYVSLGKTKDGSVPVKVKAGDYLVTAVDKKGNKETAEVNAPAGKVTEVTVQTISPKQRGGSGKQDEGDGDGKWKGGIDLTGKNCLIIMMTITDQNGKKVYEPIYNYNSSYSIDKTTTVKHSKSGDIWTITSVKKEDKDYDEYLEEIELRIDAKKKTVSGKAKESSLDIENESNKKVYYRNNVEYSFKDIPLTQDKKDGDTRFSVSNADAKTYVTSFEKMVNITDSDGKVHRDDTISLKDYNNSCNITINIFK